MTKEELIGRKFQHRITEDIYQIFKGEGNRINLKELVNNIPTSEKFEGLYTLDEAFEFTREGNDWKLLPEENKMYKTPKGIEYGVGTQYRPGNKKLLLEIKSIEGKDYFIKGLEPKVVEDYSSMDIKSFETFIDNGTWTLVTPILDYKQVDPKTITFDFTNTKIKVNNEDESKWVIEVMEANKAYLQSPEHKNNYIKEAIELIVYNCGVVYRTTTYSKDSTNKEITIQDILNNMKEVIEVGDTVVLTSYQKEDQYEVTKIEGSMAYLVNLGNWDSELKGDKGQNPLSGLKLFKKGKKKEIIGYETVVDLPGISKGSKSNKYNSIQAFFDGGLFNNAQLQDTKFFKPIYKQDAIELKFSKYTATLSKENGLVFNDGEKLGFEELQKLVGTLSKTFTKELSKVGGFEVAVTFNDYAQVRVGCKTFSNSDVKLVSDAIKKLE